MLPRSQVSFVRNLRTIIILHAWMPRRLHGACNFSRLLPATFSRTHQHCWPSETNNGGQGAMRAQQLRRVHLTMHRFDDGSIIAHHLAILGAQINFATTLAFTIALPDHFFIRRLSIHGKICANDERHEHRYPLSWFLFTLQHRDEHGSKLGVPKWISCGE